MCLEGIRRQQVDDDIEVVVIDSGSTDGSTQTAADWGANVHSISVAEFHHGRTRNLGARLAKGDTLVFTSQDARAASEKWLATLTAALRGRSDVAGVYGRQLPKAGASPPDQFFLTFLYGPEPREQRANHTTELTMETTLFSNVNSAMPRSVWEAFPFAEDVIMSEDQEWCGRVLLAGYSVLYEPHAAVHHSHNYSLVSAFRRFFDSGVSADRAYLVGGHSSSRTLRRTALSYAAGELKWLWRSGHRRWIPYSVIYELTKLLGLWLGKSHRALPYSIKGRLTAYPRHWS
jgi:glycosyltransferase involved in cell wall biosynthesis